MTQQRRRSEFRTSLERSNHRSLLHPSRLSNCCSHPSCCGSYKSRTAPNGAKQRIFSPRPFSDGLERHRGLVRRSSLACCLTSQTRTVLVFDLDAPSCSQSVGGRRNNTRSTLSASLPDDLEHFLGRSIGKGFPRRRESDSRFLLGQRGQSWRQ